MPLAPSTDGVFLLIEKSAQLFVSESNVWVAVPQTEPYFYMCETDGSFWKVKPEKFVVNVIQFFCAKKFDKLLDCSAKIIYTLTKCGCKEKWVEDCKLIFAPNPLYVGGSGETVPLAFEVLTTVIFDTVVTNKGWLTTAPGIWTPPTLGLYELDFSINLLTVSQGISLFNGILVQYYVNNVAVGVASFQKLTTLDLGEANIFDDQEVVSASAILPLVVGDSLKLTVFRTTDNDGVVELAPLLSSMTAAKVDEI
uniref:Uncharacterized protein n=1 Tax=Pithovirus LCPAC403 TaxID=2506596 RepID=A0A481ZAW4_9VIRU|nr:MAG: uncharacterized protein LCPAC403_01970 [Pithovirus LCPAC403]